MKKLLFKTILVAAAMMLGGANSWGQIPVYTQDFSADSDGGTSSNPTDYSGIYAGSCGGTYTTYTVTDGKFISAVGGDGTNTAAGYTEHYASFDAIGSGKRVVVSYDWQAGSATGKADKSHSDTKLTDASGNKILEIQRWGSNYNWKINGTVSASLGNLNSQTSYPVVITLNMNTKKIESISINGTVYATDLDFYNSDASTISRLYINQTTGSNQQIKWSNTATIDNISISYQNIITATVNAKYGETVLETEYFTELDGATLYYGWPKYILKEGTLYYNQLRSAGSQYTASTTTTTEVNKEYSIANLGTATAEYYNELGTGVTSGGSNSNYLRASHGNTTNASGSSSTEGKASMTVAIAGILPSGKYTFEIGNYKNRASIVKAGNRKVGTTSKGTNSGTYVVTTLTDVILLDNEAVTIINAQGTSATDEIDYFLAIRTGDATVPSTLGTNGYATFASSYPLDLTNLPEGLTAYKAAVEGTTVTFTELNQTVPANTGILLQGEAGGSYNIPVVASGTEVTENAFLVNTDGTTFAGDNDYYYFGLLKNTLTFGTFDPSSVAIPASKAYLKVLKSSLDAGARLNISFADDETTGVQELKNSRIEGLKTGNYYNLSGQRVDQPQKGLYIVNGKKVVIK